MKQKTYSVVSAFSVRAKDGSDVWVTRHNEQDIAKIVPAGKLEELVKAGAVVVVDGGETDTVNEESTTTRHAVKTTRGPKE